MHKLKMNELLDLIEQWREVAHSTTCQILNPGYAHGLSKAANDLEKILEKIERDSRTTRQD